MNKATPDFCFNKVTFLERLLSYFQVVWLSFIRVIFSISPHCRMYVLLERCVEVLCIIIVLWWKNACSWNLTLKCCPIIRISPVRSPVFPSVMYSSFSWVNVPTSHTSISHPHLFAFSLLAVSHLELLPFWIHDFRIISHDMHPGTWSLISLCLGRSIGPSCSAAHCWGGCRFVVFPGIRCRRL